MHRSLSILIIFAILMQSLSQLIVWSGYELNVAYIAKEFCEKKEEKNSCCKGSCYLKKELKETESREEGSSIKDKYEVMPGELAEARNVFHDFQRIKVHYIRISESVLNGCGFGVFHPPLFV